MTRNSTTGSWRAASRSPDRRSRLWDVVYALHQRGSRDVFEASARAWCALARAGAAPPRRLRPRPSSVRRGLPVRGGVRTASLARLLRSRRHRGRDRRAGALGHAGHRRHRRRSVIARRATSRRRPRTTSRAAWGARRAGSRANTDRADARSPTPRCGGWADVRLGGYRPRDTEEVRLALVERLDDTDAETRDEAIVGLASSATARRRRRRAALEEPDVSELFQMAAFHVASGAAGAEARRVTPAPPRTEPIAPAASARACGRRRGADGAAPAGLNSFGRKSASAWRQKPHMWAPSVSS